MLLGLSNRKRRPLLKLTTFRWLQAGVIALGWIPLLLSAHLPGWVGPLVLIGLAWVFALGPLVVGHPAFEITPLDLPIMGLMAILPVNLIVSADRAATLTQIYWIVIGTTAYYSVIGVLRDRRLFAWLGWGFGAMGLVLGAILLLAADWSGSGFSSLPGGIRALIPRWTPFWKSGGFQGFNVNVVSGTLALVLPVPVGFALFSRRAWVRFVTLVESLLLGGLLILSLSRGAILSVGLALLTMLVIRDRRWLLLIGVIAFGLGGVAGWLGPSQVVEVVLGPNETGTGGIQGLDRRIELWTRGIYMMRDFAFTGVGLGMVVKMLPLLYPTVLIPRDAGIEHVHNLYLQFGAETGFPGLIMLLACLLLLLALGWRGVKQARETRWAPLTSGLLGTMVVVITHSLVDAVSLEPEVYVFVWAVFGVAVALDLALIKGRLAADV